MDRAAAAAAAGRLERAPSDEAERLWTTMLCVKHLEKQVRDSPRFSVLPPSAFPKNVTENEMRVRTAPNGNERFSPLCSFTFALKPIFALDAGLHAIYTRYAALASVVFCSVSSSSSQHRELSLPDC